VRRLCFLAVIGESNSTEAFISRGGNLMLGSSLPFLTLPGVSCGEFEEADMNGTLEIMFLFLIIPLVALLLIVGVELRQGKGPSEEELRPLGVQQRRPGIHIMLKRG
jgi:hypothetical protein